MRRRMGRPGLVGTMARTAAIAGTATAVSGKVQRNQQAKAQAQAAEQQNAAGAVAKQEQDAAPAPPPAAQVAPADDMIDQLEKLADMKASGLLDDAEFAAAKARLLGR